MGLSSCRYCRTLDKTPCTVIKKIKKKEKQKGVQLQVKKESEKEGEGEEEGGFIIEEEVESIEKNFTNVLHNSDYTPISMSESAVAPTVFKRGSLRLSFEAAMSLRRRNMSLKEQNSTVC